jgi:hypothetical protein
MKWTLALGVVCVAHLGCTDDSTSASSPDAAASAPSPDAAVAVTIDAAVSPDAPACPAATVANLKDGAVVHTGFVVGTTSGAAVEVAIDDGAFAPAGSKAPGTSSPCAPRTPPARRERSRRCSW